MNAPNLAKLANDVRMVMDKRSPEILTGIGIAGMVTTTVLAVNATPKALMLIEGAKRRKGERLTKVEKIKACWKCYIPATISGVSAIACVIGANSVHAKRNAALAAAYKFSETAFMEYRDKVVETMGEKKEKTVREKVAQERVDKTQINDNEVVRTHTGDTLCLDPLSGRIFTSSAECIKRAQNTLNEQMLHNISGYVSVNDFYDELGLDHTSIGYDLGWNTERGLIKIEFSAHKTRDDRPCLAIDYVTAPTYGYDNF